MIRIIGGLHRSRKLIQPNTDHTRPTMDRVREALFSMIIHHLGTLEGSVVLDAFCGTGAIGLEALSRGAAHCSFMDYSRDVLNITQRNVALLKEEARSTIIHASTLFPPPAPRTCDLVFLDPPYGQNLIQKALPVLQEKNWISKGTLLCLEMSADDAPQLSRHVICLREKKYGSTLIALAEIKP